MVGNFDVDVEHQQRVGHLFGPLPPEMRDDTAFMDRIHAYLPGWDVPKLNAALFTDHFGLVSDFLAECWHQLRSQSRVDGRCRAACAWAARSVGPRHRTPCNKTVSGLLKLSHPTRARRVADEDLEWAVRLALECRRRVKEQQKRIGAAEFRNTHFSYTLGDGRRREVRRRRRSCRARTASATTRCRRGQVWALSPGGQDEHPGLFRHRGDRGAGQRRAHPQQPGAAGRSRRASAAPSRTSTPARRSWSATAIRARTSSRCSCAASTPRSSGAKTGVASLLALCRRAAAQVGARRARWWSASSSSAARSSRSTTPSTLAELAVEKGAKSLLLPVACRRQLFDLSDDMATKLDIEFYQDARDALLKALAD